jgi:hypothetical protein
MKRCVAMRADGGGELRGVDDVESVFRAST